MAGYKLSVMLVTDLVNTSNRCGNQETGNRNCVFVNNRCCQPAVLLCACNAWWFETHRMWYLRNLLYLIWIVWSQPSHCKPCLVSFSAVLSDNSICSLWQPTTWNKRHNNNDSSILHLVSFGWSMSICFCFVTTAFPFMKFIFRVILWVYDPPPPNRTPPRWNLAGNIYMFS